MLTNMNKFGMQNNVQEFESKITNKKNLRIEKKLMNYKNICEF